MTRIVLVVALIMLANAALACGSAKDDSLGVAEQPEPSPRVVQVREGVLVSGPPPGNARPRWTRSWVEP